MFNNGRMLRNPTATPDKARHTALARLGLQSRVSSDALFKDPSFRVESFHRTEVLLPHTLEFLVLVKS